MSWRVKSRLLWKLLGINILTIGVVIVIVWLSVNYLAAGYFTTLMEKYHISPTSSHEMFVSAIHRYLIWASVGALVLAIILSFLMMNRMLKPLTRMTAITQKIASGDYSASVPVQTQDEVGHLALAFNHMSESLQRIEQLRKTMMVDVAHELRTPLTNIRGYLEALNDGVVAPSAATFELLQEETFRLIGLVEDILRLAQADAALAGMNKTEIHLSSLIRQVLQSFRSQLNEKNLEVETRLATDEKKVWADRGQLSQVIQNLLNNCWRYAPPGETITISMAPSGRTMKTVFSNPGGDLSAENLPFIFERFYRGEKSRSRDHGGAGIGLAIVKELVEAHGGRVGAHLEHGRFHVWFELPLNQD